MGQSPPTPPPLHPPPFPGRLARRRGLLPRHRLLRQFLAESEECLRQLTGRLQPVRSRPVVPLLVALQFELQTQILEVEIVGALPLLLRPRRLLFRPLLRLVALRPRRP